MDRRSFFRSAVDKGGKTVVKAVDASVNNQASRWIRPPFAINELEFLLACTRCNDCADACPHDVIFPLSARTGARAAGTPALDLLNKGCHLCEDWPCVSACTTNAMLLPSRPESSESNAVEGESSESNENPSSTIPMPKLAKISINENLCLPYSGPECGACIASCPIEGALTLDMVKPIINEILCNGCGLCRENCITEPKAINLVSL